MHSIFRFISFIFIIFVAISSIQAKDSGKYTSEPVKGEISIPPLTDNKAYMELWEPPEAHWLIHTGQVATIFGNSGLYGNGFIAQPVCDGELCPSFESPENSDLEYLFSGALWMGGVVGSDTLVSIAADGWFTGISEFLPTHPGKAFDGPGDQSVWTVFTDTIFDDSYVPWDPTDGRAHIPMHMRVANRAYGWEAGLLSNTIIYDMVVTNIGEETINDGYIAFYFDADVYHISDEASGFEDDITGVLRDEGIGYIIDNDGDPVGEDFGYTSPTRLFAFKFLDISQEVYDTSFDWWISNGDASKDFGPQPVDEFGNVECDFGAHIGTPTGDAAKYCIMSHPGWDYDQFRTADSIPGWAYPNPDQVANFADGYDTRFLMSLGPFTIMPDSSVRILYTLFTGASVHQVTDNIGNLPDNPDQYFANLNFTDVIANANAADAIVPTITDPLKPVIGLYVYYNDFDSVCIEWDPWVFGDVSGYEIYLYEIPSDSFPYPGVAPPWITPSALDLAASVDPVYRHTFDTLLPYHIYLATVANVSTQGVGEQCEPVFIQPGGRPTAPPVDNEYVFIQPGDPAELRWSEPDGVDVDYYNIYKFANAAAAAEKYYPQYDNSEFSSEVSPTDSFYVDGQWYFYYAMEPYAQVDSGITSFSEFTDDSTVYTVTAVTKTALESDFSTDVTVLEIPLRTKDILVVSCRHPRSEFTFCDSIFSFYDEVLTGYDYDLYMFDDSTDYAYFSWDKFGMDLMSYRMVFFDAGLREDILGSSYYYETVASAEKYILSGGVFVNFGSFQTLSYFSEYTPRYVEITNNFVEDFLGIDSVFKIRLDYYMQDAADDTIIGMTSAEAVDLTMPDIAFDTSRSVLRIPFWSEDVAPIPATFRNNGVGEVTHVMRSLYPDDSWVEGHPIGIRVRTDATIAYSFGFQLFYMEHDDARALIDYLMSETSFYAVAGTNIEPEAVDVTLPVSSDPSSGKIYLGNVTGGYSVSDVDQSSLQINHTFLPDGITTEPSHPDYNGPVLRLDFALSDFCDLYGFRWGDSEEPYRVTGYLNNGYEFSSTGYISLSGYLPGDANHDRIINVGDAVFLVNYMYRGGPSPDPTPPGDANQSCEIDVGDIVYLINFIFKYGASPLPGCSP